MHTTSLVIAGSLAATASASALVPNVEPNTSRTFEVMSIPYQMQGNNPFSHVNPSREERHYFMGHKRDGEDASTTDTCRRYLFLFL